MNNLPSTERHNVDGLLPRVNLDIAVWDVDGNEPILIDSTQRHNLVTLAGRNLIRDLLYWNSTADNPRPFGLNYFSAGTSTAAFAASSTALGTEVFRDSFTQRTKTDGQTVYKYYLTSNDANGNTLTEAGLHGNSSSTGANTGELYAGALYTAIAKTTSIAITYSWTLTWADDGV